MILHKRSAYSHFLISILDPAKKLLIILIILILVSCASGPSEKQSAFSEKLLKTPTIVHTEWANNLTLWVKVNPDSFGIHARTKAQELANEIASVGVKETQKNICVVIYFTSYKEIASTCINL